MQEPNFRTIRTLVLFLSVSLFISTNLHSQLSRGGIPKSFRLGLTADIIERVNMPSVDTEALSLEDIDRAQSNLPYRFAQAFEVNYNLYNSGTWKELANGDRIWRLKVTCKDAKSINFLYDQFFIPKGGLVYIYSEDLSEVLGAFGNHNNRASGKFATGLLNNTSVVIEYFEPAAVLGQGSISINQVAHGYRDFDGVVGIPEALGDSGACQVNINCSPEGDNWQVEKKSVARIIINGIETCTGSLINNIAQDCTPYFLTANHCIDNTYDAITNPDISGAVFYWNYERPDCANTGTVPIETTAGATLVANSDPPGGDATASDFALFELTEDPSDSYDVYAAGFDASGAPGETGVGIHHPGLDAKKIATHSIIPDIVVNDNYWRIYWDETDNGHSVTEGGSSGSGLFNEEGRLIGQLFGGFLGGQPNCNDPFDDEGDYGRISVSWDGIAGTTQPERRLRDWLDPNDSGNLVVDGTYCTTPDYALATSPSNNTNCGTNSVTYTVDVISQNGYTDDVDLSVSGLPTGATASFATNPVTPGNSTTMTVTGLSGIADGSYDFLLEGSSTSGDKSINVGLDIADQSAAILTEPLDGAIDVSTAVLLIWESDIGVSSYDVEVATDPTFTTIVASANVNTNNWTVSPALDILTTFYWRVRHVRTCGNDPWSTEFSFTTAEATPGTCGNPIQMICGGTYSGNNDTGENNFEQHDAGGANNWTGPELIFEFEAGTGDIEVVLSGLSSDLDLYLFTDCGDVIGSELDESESGGSSTETVTANVSQGVFYIMVDGYLGNTSDFVLDLTCLTPGPCPALAAPVLLTPLDNAVGVPVNPVMTWEPEPMAVSYDVQVSTDDLFNNIVASANVTTESWTVSPDLLVNANYYWRTRNWQSCGADPWSETRTFITDGPSYFCPMSEDFESGQPSTWTFTAIGTNASWNFNNSVLPGGIVNPGNGDWAVYSDFLTGVTGQNNIVTANSPVIDMSNYIDIELKFDYAFADDAAYSETVSLSITDQLITYYWDGAMWTDIASTWITSGSVTNGIFSEFIPTDLDPSVLEVQLEYNDGNAPARGGFGFDNFEVCGEFVLMCSITSADASNILCNDNGTSNPADDFFTFILDAAGSNLGTTYSVSGDYTQAALSYGVPTNINNNGAGFLISNGDLALTLTDDLDAGCNFATTVLAPDVCSVPDPCTEDFVLTGTETGIADYEAITIESTQQILNGASVDYDVTDLISLDAGFEVQQGAVFEAFIDAGFFLL